MQFFNSLTKQTEEFVPNKEGKVTIYVCGLTPYDSAHIGHARTCVSFDVIKRYLKKKGYSVFHIQNITDVDDKIIKRCKELGADPKQLTTQNHDEALELFDLLKIQRADLYPKVTEHIKEIIDLVKLLIKEKKAYETESGVYYSIASFSNYGNLSGQKLEEIKAGARVEVDESKKDPGDFALWKKTSGEIIEFVSPWGTGRPGWHIECSAMALKYARQLDIHGGARDLIFPHHENEIAQSEGATDHQFSKYWLHAGFLTVNGEKMSKSLGNFLTVKAALEKNSANALRLFYLQSHYRSPLDYSEESLNAMEESVERIFNTLGLIREALSKPNEVSMDFRSKVDKLVSQFYAKMDEDVNTPEALAVIFSLLRLANSHTSTPSVDREALSTLLLSLEDLLSILGLEKELGGSDLSGKVQSLQSLLNQYSEVPPRAGNSPEQMVDALIALRESYRKKKNYGTADEIRKLLGDIGITLEDKKDQKGKPSWKLV